MHVLRNLVEDLCSGGSLQHLVHGEVVVLGDVVFLGSEMLPEVELLEVACEALEAAVEVGFEVVDVALDGDSVVLE